MSARNLKILAAVAALLMILSALMQFNGDDSSAHDGLLFPDLKSKINDITSLTVTRADPDSATVISKTEDNWVVASKDNFPADTGKLRNLLLQIADARIIERKTANPDYHERLGVQDPGLPGSKGIRLELGGAGFSYDLVVGNITQSRYRYVRIFADPQSWLIDRTLDLPDNSAKWLLSDVIDIDSVDVRAVEISHPDGTVIRISKESSEATDFVVADIPDGRELSYATVANGIAGGLNALTLDDVRKGPAFGAEAVTTIFDTTDGTRIAIQTERHDDGSWITLQATADGDDSVSSINKRVRGWQFKIADYKANQLSRHWDDILRAESE